MIAESIALELCVPEPARNLGQAWWYEAGISCR